MKAPVLRRVGAPLEIEDIQISQPGAREVLVRTAARCPTRCPWCSVTAARNVVEAVFRVAAPHFPIGDPSAGGRGVTNERTRHLGALRRWHNPPGDVEPVRPGPSFVGLTPTRAATPQR
jgi:hypothetical protein